MSVEKSEYTPSDVEVGDDSLDPAGILATTAFILGCESEEVPDRVTDLIEAQKAAEDFVDECATFRG